MAAPIHRHPVLVAGLSGRGVLGQVPGSGTRHPGQDPDSEQDDGRNDDPDRGYSCLDQAPRHTTNHDQEPYDIEREGHGAPLFPGLLT